jgi:hypothetical protein
MVVKGDFQIEIVEAQTKVPYKEHTKDGKTYAEVEPNAEYWISIQKVRAVSFRSQNILVMFKVDGKDLGWFKYYPHNYIDKEPRCVGLCECKDGVVSSRALRFVKPEILAGIGSASSEPMIGNMEVEIYEGVIIYVDNSRHQDKLGIMEATTVSSRGGTAEAKFVRSAAGETTHLTPVTSAKAVKGAKLETITLHYCTVPGLMHVGVVTKPDNIWEAYKMINPHKKQPRLPPNEGLQPKRTKITKTMQVDGRQVVMEEKYQDTFDLSQLPSDSEDDDDYTPPAVIPNVTQSRSDAIPSVTQLETPAAILTVTPSNADVTRSS